MDARAHLDRLLEEELAEGSSWWRTAPLALALAGCSTINMDQCRSYYRPGQVFVSDTATHSMIPALQPGGKVRVVHTDFSRVKLGDIVVRRVNWKAATIVHRVVGKRGGGWLTRGDDNREPDPGWMTADDFLAVVEKA